MGKLTLLSLLTLLFFCDGLLYNTLIGFCGLNCRFTLPSAKENEMFDSHSQQQAEQAVVQLLEQQGIRSTYNAESGVIILPRPDRDVAKQVSGILSFLLEIVRQNDLYLDNAQTRENLIEIFIQIFAAHRIAVEYDQASGSLLVPKGFESVDHEQLGKVLTYVLYLLGYQDAVYKDSQVSYNDKYGLNTISIINW